MKDPYKQTLLLHLLMIGVPILIMSIALTIAKYVQVTETVPSLVRFLTYLYVIPLFPATMVLRKQFAQSRTGASDALKQRFFSKLFITAAFCSAPAPISLLLLRVGHSLLDLYALTSFSLLTFITFFPRHRDWLDFADET